jgi:iron complex outermembrane receptor protein
MITRTRKLRAAFACLLALPLSALGMDLDKKVEFHIPAQDLSTALIEFSKQARLQVIVSTDLTGKTTQGVSGQKAIRQALSQLLDSAGLSYRLAGETSITVGKSTGTEPHTTAAGSGNAWIRLAQADPETGRDAGEAREITKAKIADIGIPEILVKGSRSLNIDIARTRDDAQPYVIFNREKIEESAAGNLETFLRDRLSMNTVGMATSQRLTQSGSGSTFNLRGLGATQTLILIDGHRPAPGTSFGASPRQADLNSIPMSAVERIEVLPATASGIYGGSATGGVINIVLRHDYSGVEAKATYGNTFASDVAQRRFDLAAGFNPGENTNLMVMGSYSDQNDLLQGERKELVARYYDIARANAPARLVQPPLAYTPNIRSANGSNLVLDDGRPLNSPITHVPVGYAGGDGGTAFLANAGTYNLDLAGTHQAPAGGGFQIAQAPRIESLRAEVRHEFSPRVKAFLDGTFSETYTSGRAPVTLGALVPYRVSASAPNNPFTTDILVTAPINFADYIETTQTQKSVLGGVIFSLPRSWQAEADYTWARTRLRQGGYLATGGAENARVANGTINLVRDTNVFPVDLTPILAGTEL